nr:ribosomal protein S18-alanine N-acetyltransferase [uncultured Merdimonas sp.]
MGELEKEIFPDAWSVRSLTETWEQKTSVMITARKDGELVGYLIVYLVQGEGEIARIAVKKDCRRQGVAGHMVLELENVCEEQKVHKLMLEVRESNLDAISFYKDKGFTEDGLRKSYYSDPTEDAVLMSRELGR